MEDFCFCGTLTLTFGGRGDQDDGRDGGHDGGRDDGRDDGRDGGGLDGGRDGDQDDGRDGKLEINLPKPNFFLYFFLSS